MGSKKIVDAEETKREKARQLRYKKPIVKDLNLDSIMDALPEAVLGGLNQLILRKHFHFFNSFLLRQVTLKSAQMDAGMAYTSRCTPSAEWRLQLSDNGRCGAQDLLEMGYDYSFPALYIHDKRRSSEDEG